MQGQRSLRLSKSLTLVHIGMPRIMHGLQEEPIGDRQSATELNVEDVKLRRIAAVSSDLHERRRLNRYIDRVVILLVL